MNIRLFNPLILVGVMLLLSCNNQVQTTESAQVSVGKKDNGSYRLYVNGEEFYVKGAGLEFGNIAALSKYGANSFRTWRTENGERDAIEILDEAYKNGLMVLMGLEMGRERHGFDYNDTVAVRIQREYIRSEVLRLKDHPALLAWAIGNELNLLAENLRVFDAVNEISEMIHEIDPNHPTTTTLAGIGKREIDYIKQNCNDIDFISIQMYGDVVNLQQRISDAGWDGPYMVTEWGATGHWEVPLTNWGAPIEQTSQEKAKSFINRYDLAIAADPRNCLGSYVFLWGQKQERTPTWYGMFLENGAKTETVDAMYYIWTGRWPENRCPSIDSVLLNRHTAYESISINKDGSLLAEVYTVNFENDSLIYQWEILQESTDLGVGGDFESRPETIFKTKGENKVKITTPNEGGPYRLFVYVLDKEGNAATANIPFYVNE